MCVLRPSLMFRQRCFALKQSHLCEISIWSQRHMSHVMDACLTYVCTCSTWSLLTRGELIYCWCCAAIVGISTLFCLKVRLLEDNSNVSCKEMRGWMWVMWCAQCLRNHAISFEATEDAAAANDDELLDDDVAPDGSACFYAAAAGRGFIIGWEGGGGQEGTGVGEVCWGTACTSREGSDWIRCPGQDFFFSDIYASIAPASFAWGNWVGLPRHGPQHDSCFEQCCASCLVFMCTRLPPTTRINDPRAMVWWCECCEFDPIIFLRNFCLCSLNIKYYRGSLPACYTSYTDLFNCWIRAIMGRVKISSGAAHIETSVSKLPLSPGDAAVLQQAIPQGWDTCSLWLKFYKDEFNFR